MANPTYIDFGGLLLRKLLQRSRIFDLWRSEMRDDPGRPCLIRRMIPPYTMGEEFVNAFLERCRALEKLHLHGALPLLSSGVADDIPYAVLEGVKGWTLQEILAHRAASCLPVPLELTLQIVLSVARVLATAHDRADNPLVHGALRPRSIWIDTAGTVRVGDFEVGALAEIELTSLEGQDERAWRFQALERPESWASPAPAVDVFSVTAVLLELLAVGSLSVVEIKLDAIDQLPVLESRGVPEALLELIHAGQSEAPEDRPSMAEVVRVLKEAAGLQTEPSSSSGRTSETSFSGRASEAPASGQRSEPPLLSDWLSGVQPSSDPQPESPSSPDRPSAAPPSDRPSAAPSSPDRPSAAPSSPVRRSDVHSLSSWLAANAPPIEELDPLAKVDPASDRYLRKPIRRRPEVKNGPPVMTELEAAAAHGEGSHGRVYAVVALVLLLAAVGGYALRGTFQRMMVSPGGDMVLLIADSVPPGATVTLSDGRVLGLTPFKAPVLADAGGTLSLSARLDGFAPAGPIRREARPGDEVQVSFRLEPRPEGPAAARIVTTPPGAKVVVDGKARGITPLEVAELHSAQEHQLSVSLAGYRAESRTFRVEVGKVIEVSIPLERRVASKAGKSEAAPVAATPEYVEPVDAGLADYSGPVGYLLFESTPWATVTVDGVTRGRSSTGKKTPIPVGRHTVKYESWDRKKVASRDVTVRDGEIQVLEYDFNNGGWRLAPYRPF